MKTKLKLDCKIYSKIQDLIIDLFGIQNCTFDKVHEQIIIENIIYLRVHFGDNETKIYFSSIPAGLYTTFENMNKTSFVVYSAEDAETVLKFKQSEINLLKTII